MQKRKSLFSIAVVVLVLVLAVAMLVACNNDQPKAKYTIKFDTGEGRTTTITLEEGEALNADWIPADLIKLGHKFLGWYNGETKCESGMTFNADTTFVAKFERTGYVITISFGEADADDIVRVVDLDDATLPAEILPEAPSVKDKAFRGYFNGNVEAQAGMEITDDVTFVAVYYGKEIYDGVFVNEDSKLVAILDKDYFYLGTEYISRENFTFNTQTGAMEYPKPQFGTGWTFSLVDGVLNVAKISSETMNYYTLTEVTDSVDYEGTYAKDGYSKLTILKGGFVFVGSTPEYQYLKISADGEGYVLTAVESDGAAAETATVTFDKDGHIVISDIYEGIWLKNANVELSISVSGISITKFSVGSKFVYVYKDSHGETQIVEADKELTETDGNIVTFTLKDNSEIIIKVSVTIENNQKSVSYRCADNLKGTYTAGAQTLKFDGFGKVEATSTDANGYNGTYSYAYNNRDQLIVGNLFMVVFGDDSFEIVAKDAYVGTYKVLGAGSLSSTITLDGFGYVESIRGSEKSTGSYTINDDKITITATIVGTPDDPSSFNGEYTILYDGGTLTKDDNYWCKEGGDDRFNELRGKWVDADERTLVIDAGAGFISVEFNDVERNGIKVLKPDRSVITFTYISVYTITIGETENTLKLTWGANESIFTRKIVADEAFFGTWSNNDDEAIKIVVEDEETIKVDFDATEGEDTLVSATLTAASAEEITIVVDGNTYTISINNGELTVISSDDNSVNYQLQKHIIPEKYIGVWKATNEADGPLNLVITGRKVTLNGVNADSINPDTNVKLQFEIDGVNYAFWAFGELDYNGLEIYMSKDNTSGGETGDNIITNSEFFGNWTWEDGEMDPTSGTVEITANSVKINGVEVTNLVEEDSSYYFEITFTYNGSDYAIYKQSSYYGMLRLELRGGSYPFANLSQA